MKLVKKAETVDLPIKINRFDTFWNRFRGLMFRLKPLANEGILIDPCNSIHMFFMFFAIDVVFVNQNSEIVFFKEKVNPWTAIFPIKNAKATLELPVGTISKYQFKVGDKIVID